MPHNFPFPRRAWAVVSLLALLLASGLALACDTPVYRYAMYRWEPHDYLVYHFHSGEVSPAFAEVQEKLRNANEQSLARTNIAVRLVNVAEDPELQSVPPEVRKLREKHSATPLSLVVNPLGVEVFHGELGIDEVDAILASPSRDELGKLLAAGHAGVLVLVLGADDELNAAAQKTSAKLVADVNEGKLSLYRKPDIYDPLALGTSEPADDKAPAEPPHTVAALTYARDELAAQDPWLLKGLMGLEADLGELQSEPMLFVVYGRGRALPPYVGKGITPDNLVDITNFITGACSCTVKEQNPGVDLLMAFDWEGASAAVAKKFGAEEGSGSLGDLFPQLIPQTPTGETTFPSNASASAVPIKATVLSPVATNNKAPSAAPEQPSDAEQPVETNAPPVESETASDLDPQVVERNEILANIDTRYAPRPTQTEKVAERVASSQLLVPLGMCLAIGFVALLAVTFLVLKPQ